MPVSETNTGATPMQMAWVMTMFVFALAFFLVFFTIYFFRPKKSDKIIPLTGEKQLPVTINAPGRPPLQVRVEITWSNTHLPADKVMKRGMGIRFIETGEDAVCLINDAISQDAAAAGSDQ